MNCLYSFIPKNGLESYKKVCEDKHSFSVRTSSNETKILESIWYRKSYQTPFAIYAYFESLIKSIQGCVLILENLQQQK